MSHMFCTLKEAAQTLETSEDQIHALLERGLLHEFREGRHRLLREAEVEDLDRKRRCLAEGRRSPRSAVKKAPTERAAPSRRSASRAGRRSSDSSPAAAGKSLSGAPGAAATSATHRTMRGTSGKGRAARRDSRPSSGGQRAERGMRKAQGTPRKQAAALYGPGPSTYAFPDQSLRDWLWLGLLQDRPAAIALLTTLVLLGLSALGAGLYYATKFL